MFKVVSLFTGCGGIDLGLKGGFNFLDKTYYRLPFKIVFANENDEGIANLYNDNFISNVTRGDARKLSISKIPRHNLLVAGLPCKSFSMIAQNPPRMGFDDENGQLFEVLLKILKNHKPEMFMIENVKGMISANKGVGFELLLMQLKKCGYKVDYKILNSKDFGIPQKRERVFIVGTLGMLNFAFPEPIKGKAVPLKTVLESKVDQKYHFSKRAIEGMEKANANYKAKMNRGRIQNINECCNTITSHLAKVSLNSTDPVLKTKLGYRRFTPREVARIQSFPEKYKLNGSENKNYIALGNAVPPLLMWHLGKKIKKCLSKK